MPKQNKQTNKKEINEDGAAAAAVKSTNDDFFLYRELATPHLIDCAGASRPLLTERRAFFFVF